jgi:hypothetical protein
VDGLKSRAAAETVPLNKFQFLSESHRSNRRAFETARLDFEKSRVLSELKSAQFRAISETGRRELFKQRGKLYCLNPGA